MTGTVPLLPDMLLAPLQALLTRNIQASTAARELLAGLSGKVMAVHLRETGVAVYLRPGSESLQLSFHAATEPGAVMSTGLVGLLRLVAEDPETLLRAGLLRLDGDPELARQFQALLHQARPDWEEELSRLLGDVAAHQLGNLARGLFAWGREAGESLQRNAAEYLQEESRDLVAPAEARDFMQQVDSLRDDVERAAARLRRLETGAGLSGKRD